MKSSTIRRLESYIQSRVHLMVVMALVTLALAGRMPESSAGWVVWPPAMVTGASRIALGRCPRSHGRCRGLGWHAQVGGGRPLACRYVRQTWHLPLLRSGLLVLLRFSGSGACPVWLIGLPWVVWTWRGLGLYWPWLRRVPEWCWATWAGEQAERVLLAGAVGLALGAAMRTLVADQQVWQGLGNTPLWAGACVTCGGEQPSVTVERSAAGDVSVTLCGHFTMRVSGADPFRVRILALFLRQLEVPGEQRGSRRTRDGRTPFVRQEALSSALGIVHPDLSRWERYWLEGDWRRLLSLHSSQVLTLELQRQIVAVFATFPWWGADQVHGHLRQQGVAVSLAQVQQAARESGWTLLRQALVKHYHLTAQSLRPRDEWLVGQLLCQIQHLLQQLEAGGRLTVEERVEIANLETLAAEVGVEAPPPPLGALPWLLRLEQLLFGHWEAVADAQVRCIYCGSTEVARKSRQARLKRFYDAQGQGQTVEVYRYYCHNPACDKRSFTNLPPGLVPYSPFRPEVHLLAVQMYAWGYSTYRRTAGALGVAPFTVYRWVSALGHQALSVAALFGSVRSSGVVGIDEKFVLVPKNNKPPGKMRRWMYVYVAVDLYTYDLLHIAIYPYNSQASAHAFLLALRAKGYRPRAIVTDLREDYATLLPRVFPTATHHECIFHALQNLHDHLETAYGPDYAQTNLDALALRQTIHAIFDARTKRTAQQRYAALLASREAHLAKTPQLASLFDFLQHHWPRLLNGIESKTIPRTNNVTEEVIRRFDQHYQNFCGFENLATTQLYLVVFEKLYRFTPFSDDAQPRLRGKCPLQLAGYEIGDLPITAICAGWSPHWQIPALPPPASLVPSP